jgi:AcrR family transcriptional regulator
MRLFDEVGFDPVSVGQIAGEAGVSVPTFYAHYPSKDRIVLQPAGPREILQLLAEHASAPSITEQVERSVVGWLTSIDGEAQVELLRQWRLVGETRTLQLRAAEIERMFACFVVEELEYVRCDEKSLAVQLTVFSLFAASTQILMRWAARDGRHTLAQVCDEVLTTWRSLRTCPV